VGRINPAGAIIMSWAIDMFLKIAFGAKNN